MTIVIVHHLRKTGTDEKRTPLKKDPHQWLEAVSGSSAFIAHLETTLGLEKDTEGVYTFSGIRRNGPEPLLCLESNPETLRFDLVSDEALLSSTIFSRSEKELWNRLPQEFKWAEAKKTADGKTGNLSRTLNKALDHDMLVQSSETRLYQKRSLS